MRCLTVLTAAAALLAPAVVRAEDAKGQRRLLLVTHSGGFIHDSVGVAEEVLKEVGPKHGFAVTCYRFTGDPDEKGKSGRTVREEYGERFRARTGVPVEKAHCGRVNAETLKNFDVVLFFTTGNPLTKEELKDLTAWVKAGGAFCGTHCATDTLYNTSYGELIGGYFLTHPSGLQKIRVKVEDPKHPGAKGFTDGQTYQDEMYIFRDLPYSRDRLHIILSIDKESFKPNKARPDGDYAISWCHRVGKGRVFYTSFGHSKDVWHDERFQESLIGGIKWATGQLPGDDTPSGKK